MKIRGIVWLRDIVDKLAAKHHVEPNEVEEVLGSTTQFRFVEKASAGEKTCILL
jgi:hypothetical protein